MTRTAEILLLTTLGAILIVPPLKLLNDKKGERQLIERLARLSQEFQQRLDEQIPSRTPEDRLPQAATLRETYASASGQGAPANGAGTSSSRTGSAPPGALVPFSTVFFTREELSRFEERRRREGEWRSTIAPPLNLSGFEILGRGVLIRWDPNPRNTELIKTTGIDPLLEVAYHVYRWTKDSRPVEIAKLGIDTSEFLDQDLKAYPQEYRYSVLTVLEGRLGEAQAIIESERSSTISVRSSEWFEIEILKGNTDGVSLAVTRTGPGARYRHEFFVKPGSRVGRKVEVAPGKAIDFDTGLTLKSVREVVEESRVDVQRPAFEPDGRRQVDPVSGDPVFETVPTTFVVHRLVLECEDLEGESRRIEARLGPPQEIQ